MFKKLINKIIMGTKCYLVLREKLEDKERHLHKLNFDFTLANNEIAKLQKQRDNNIKIAKQIVKTVNSLIKRNESIKATKDIKVLCNEIIKGE